jgi:hypothetical protein
VKSIKLGYFWILTSSGLMNVIKCYVITVQIYVLPHSVWNMSQNYVMLFLFIYIRSKALCRDKSSSVKCCFHVDSFVHLPPSNVTSRFYPLYVTQY